MHIWVPTRRAWRTWICSSFPRCYKRRRHYGRPSEKRMKRDRSGGGGLQTFTKLVCEKLEREKEMSNTDVASPVFVLWVDCRDTGAGAHHWRCKEGRCLAAFAHRVERQHSKTCIRRAERHQRHRACREAGKDIRVGGKAAAARRLRFGAGSAVLGE